MIFTNHKPVYVARQEIETVEERKREQKQEDKRIVNAAKEQKRVGRDDDMSFFIAYYKEKFPGVKFKDFKKA